jgi:hypothetical protein
MQQIARKTISTQRRLLGGNPAPNLGLRLKGTQQLTLRFLRRRRDGSAGLIKTQSIYLILGAVDADSKQIQVA